MSTSKKNLDLDLPAKLSQDTLIPTQIIIKLAKNADVDFGPGDPAERIRYFIKLGILEHQIRKIADGKFAKNLESSKNPVGHLPYSSLDKLIYVNRLSLRGLTYPKIAQKIKKKALNMRLKQLEDENTIAKSSPIVNTQPPIALFSKTGIGEKEIQKKLENQGKQLHKQVDEKITRVLRTGQLYEKPSKLKFITKRAAAVVIFTSVSGLLLYSTLKFQDGQRIQKENNLKSLESANILGEVLAASSEQHRFYVDADAEVSGTTLFGENITAPNVIYSVAAGTGISVTGGQTPTIALDATGIVNSVNSQSGALTLTGSGGTSISASGGTITISSSDSGGDITAVNAGDGLSGGGSSGDITLSADVTSSGTSSTTSSSTGLEIASGISLLRGCSNSEVLAWVSATSTWDCSATGGGGFTSFTLAGDSGTNQTISDGNTLTIAGGTNGIDTVTSATDTITLNLDTTEIGTTTFGSGSGFTWTFDSGATDPAFTFGSNSLTIGSAATVTATDVTALNLGAATLDFNGAGTLQYGDGSNFLIQDDSGNDIFLLTGSTDALSFGNTTDNNAYSFLGSGSFTISSLDCSSGDQYVTTNGSGVLSCGTDNDSATNLWTDGGAYIYPTSGEVLGNSASDGANKIAGIYVADDTGIIFGTTNDFTLSYDEATDNRLELTPATATGVFFIDGGTTDRTADLVALDVDVNSASVDGIFIDLDVGTALSAAEIANGLHIDAAGLAGDNAAAFINGIYLVGDTTTGATATAIDIEPTWDIDISLQNDETISNTVDGTIAFGATTLSATSTTAFNLGAATVDFNGNGTIQYANGSNFLIQDDSGADIFNLTGATDVIAFGNATDNNAFTFLGTGLVTITGNLSLISDLSILGGNINFGADTTIGDGGDQIAFSLEDNTTNALDIQESTNNYININTTNASENIAFGNATTNPSFSFLGSGAVTITGSAEGTNALTLTAGDLTITDGDLIVSSGETILTSDANATVLGIFADSVTTGNAFSLSVDGLTTGNGLQVTSTSQSGDESKLAYLSTTVDNASLEEAYGIYLDFNNNPSAANRPYGFYLDFDDSTTQGSTIFGSLLDIDVTGDSANTIYGNYTDVVNTGLTGAGTVNSYGGYYVVTGSTGGTSSTYGIYTTAQSADNNYAIYIPDQAGGGNNYGLYIAGADDYAIYTAADDIAFNLATGSNDKVLISGNSSTSTAGILDVDMTGNNTTNGNKVASFYGLYSGADDTNGYGIFVNQIYNGGNGPQVFGAAIVTADTVGNIQNTNALDTYGLYVNSAQTNQGGFSSGVGNANQWGVYSLVSQTNTSSDTNDILNTYGGYFVATNQVTGGNNVNYGLYSSATGAENNYGLFIGDIATGSNTGDYGLYVAGADDYAIYTAADDVAFILGASDKVTVDGSTTSNTTTAGVLDIDVTSTTNQNTGINLNYSYNGSSGIGYGVYYDINRANNGSAVYGTYMDFSHNNGTNGNIDFGNYINLANTGTVTTGSQTSYGMYITGTSTTNFNLGITKTVYGLVSDVTLTTSSASPTVTTYGAFIRGTSNTTGTGTAYGLYVDATGGDNNYIIFMGSAPSTANTTALCWDNSGASAVYDCDGSATDLAENFATTDETIEAADIVTLDGSNEAYLYDKPDAEGNIVKTTKASILKSSAPYQSSILGIVSTQPNQVYGEDGVFDESENPKPVSLAGRVPVKVSVENGEIKAGDFITSSSTPGVGMKATKAGRTVGVALENYSGTQQGSIIVFVEPGWYVGTNLASNGSLIETNPEFYQGEETQLAQNPIDQFGLLVETGALDGQILTAEQVRYLVEYEVGKKFEGLLASNQLPGTSNQQTSEQESTDSAQPDETIDQNLADLDQLLATTNLQLDTLLVTGISQLAQTQVAGTFSQDGTLIIDYGKQINALGTTLFLQNDPLSGNELGVILDIGNGDAVFDDSGNLILKGSLTAKRLTTDEIEIATNSGNSPTIGSAQIAEGQSEIAINTTAVKPEAKILITATNQTQGKTLYIKNKSDFEGFTVAIDTGPATSNINFDWLIINTKNISQAN